jgi:hypothetical protein
MKEALEAAEKLYPINDTGSMYMPTLDDLNKLYKQQAFIRGAKWQQEQQDDFIIKFLEFIEGTYSYSNIFDHWYLHSHTSKTYTKKELLEQFKKNKV